MSNLNLPKGFVLRADVLTEKEEAAVVAILTTIPFGSVRMHGVVAKRRVAQFGRHYAFESFRLTQAPELPNELDFLRGRAAAIAGIPAADFRETLVTEYP